MKADFSLDYDVLTFQKPQTLYLMARLAAGPAPKSTERRPLNIGLVIDRSGSMSGRPLEYTRDAAKFLVQHLGVQDQLSIVLYDDRIKILLPPQPVHNKDQINQLIDTIYSRGTTNLSGGWLEGCNQVKSSMMDGALNRVLLMSDGQANAGVTEIPQLRALAEQKYAGDGVSTTTMGLGDGFNEDLMMAMAEAGGGAFYFIESPEVTPIIFQEELAGLLSVVGQNLTITLTLSKHVSSGTQLNTYPSEVNGHEVKFQLGDVFADEEKTLMLELVIPALDHIGACEIARLRFEYDQISGDQTQHQVHELPVMVNVQADGPVPEANPDVVQSMLLLKAADARRQAVESADAGDYDGASQALSSMAEAIAQSGINDPELDDERSALLDEAQNLQGGAYDAYMRKSMSTHAMWATRNRHDEVVAMRSREAARRQHNPAAHNNTPSHVTWGPVIWELKGDLMRIGRLDHNEIQINAEGVSDVHCQLVRFYGNWLIEDNGSQFGTELNGHRVKSPVRLSPGDVVTVAGQQLMFR